MDSLREKWLKEEWERVEEARRHKEIMKKKDEQLYQLCRELFDLTFDKTKLCDLSLNLLSCRWLSPSYPAFLWECYYLFQLKAIYENRSYMGSSTRTFLEIFRSCDFDHQSLLCELFLHIWYYVWICEHEDGGECPSFHGRLAAAGIPLIPLIYEESDWVATGQENGRGKWGKDSIVGQG